MEGDNTLPPANIVTSAIIPEDVPLRCTYDPEQDAFRCSAARWWQEPGIYFIGASAIIAFGLGFVIASSKTFQAAIGKLRNVPASFSGPSRLRRKK